MFGSRSGLDLRVSLVDGLIDGLTAAPDCAPKQQEEAIKPLEDYQTDPIAYSREVIGIEPWKGEVQPGQYELFEDIGTSVRRQLAGEETIKIFRVEAGHGVGKTLGTAVLVNWFFDAFSPSITYTTAPSKEQVESLLWKDIKKLRPSHLPGRVLPGSPRMEKGPDHWAVGKTTNDSGGKGTERVQGQHDDYLMFVLDEAEGVPDYVYDAVDAMMTGGKVIIVILIGNPRTRTSKFFRWGRRRDVKSYRWSVLEYPNVVWGREIVPGGTGRSWLVTRIENWCEIAQKDNPDENTFRLSFDIEMDGRRLPAGTIFKPSAEFLFRVMGVAPANLANKCFVSAGRYEAALRNEPLQGQDSWVRIGVDCARFGEDSGTIYVRHAGRIWRASQVSQQDSFAYLDAVKRAALPLASQGVKSLHIRVDGSGGFGIGVIDLLRHDEELISAFLDFKVFEVQFGGAPHDGTKYRNLVTEMYAESAETLLGVRLGPVPPELEADLTERLYGYVNVHGRALKQLEEKGAFKKRNQDRSPDDGDGFALAASPDHIFKTVSSANPLPATKRIRAFPRRH